MEYLLIVINYIDFSCFIFHSQKKYETALLSSFSQERNKSKTKTYQAFGLCIKKKYKNFTTHN